jgi:hypothetical protein
MYSAGLDSVGVLYRLLTVPEFEDKRVHVHHLHLVNRENRAVAERAAVGETLSLIKADPCCREFVYTESLHNYRFMRKHFIWDMDFCAFMAGQISLADPRVRYVALGRTRTDVEGAGFDFRRRMERAQAIFKSVRMLAESEAEYIFPVVRLTKREIWDMLPEDLRRAAWSCRTPVYGEDKRPVHCGRCITCRDLAEHVPEALESGKN